MQQQATTTTSNLQIKLITDARKLLEKVRSQQAISADSSFDSSFLFDAMSTPDKDMSMRDRDREKDMSMSMSVGRDGEKGNDKSNGNDKGKEEMITDAIDAIRARTAAAAAATGEGGGGSPSPLPLPRTGQSQNQSHNQSLSQTATTEREPRTKSSPSNTNTSANTSASAKSTMSNMSNISNHKLSNSKNTINKTNTNNTGIGLPPRKPPTPKSTSTSTAKAINRGISTNSNSNSDCIVHVLQEKPTNANIHSNANANSNSNVQVENLQKENMKLKIENYELHEEMSDFEYKLYCLEHTLGIIEDVERSSQSSQSQDQGRSQDRGQGQGQDRGQEERNNIMNMKRPNPLVIQTSNSNGNSNGNGYGNSNNNSSADNFKLSPITAMVADAMIDASGGANGLLNDASLVNGQGYGQGQGHVQGYGHSSSSPGRQAPPNTPVAIQSHNHQHQNNNKSQSLTQQQKNELHLLRENNSKMVIAIKALAQATIAQTRKHYLYKKRHHMTKLMVVEETEKALCYKNEAEVIQHQYYQTRSDFLKERDIREELSSELQLVARKNNLLRREREVDERMKQSIRERLEWRDDGSGSDAMSVLSRLSQSSCFPVLQTITEAGSSTSENSNSNSNSNSNNGNNNNNNSSGGGRSERDKGVEKLVFKLISQLKKRDEKIAKLEKKLKITMQYLEGALELEVARQDAEIASVKSGGKENGTSTCSINGNASVNVVSVATNRDLDFLDDYKYSGRNDKENDNVMPVATGTIPEEENDLICFDSF